MKNFTLIYKSLALLVVCCGLAVSAMAQPFNLSGTVTDNNGNPVAGQDITIWSDSASGLNYNNTVQTATNGTYSVSIANGAQSGQNVVYNVWTIDSCGNSSLQTVSNNQGNTSSGVADFTLVCAGNPVGCQAYFSTINLGSSMFNFFGSGSSGVGITYSWDFGDGNTSTAINPTHTYNSIGSYLVCLTVSNAFCSDTYCDSVVIGPPPPACSAAFTATPTSMAVDFVSNSSNATTYSWDFGDGNTSTAVNPTHTYASTGIYTVTLVITDGSTCSDSAVGVVNVTNQFDLGGSVWAGNFYAEYYRVYLIEHDASAGTLTAVDSMDLSPQDSSYLFQNIPSGDYLVKAALLSNDPNYSSYVPTYHGSSLTWANATTVTVGPSAPWSVHINLVAGTNTGGPGFVGGLISQGANKTSGPGDPVPNQLVILLDQNGDPVGYDVSDANGEYSFDNIPYGTYTVYAEALNKETFPPSVTVSEDYPQIDVVDLQVFETMITSDYIAVGTPELNANELNLRIYPNPVVATTTLMVETEEARTLHLSLVNVLGTVVFNEQRTLARGENTWDLSVEALAPGLYYLQAESTNTGYSKVIPLLKK